MDSDFGTPMEQIDEKMMAGRQACLKIDDKDGGQQKRWKTTPVEEERTGGASTASEELAGETETTFRF
ncbi:hypothetical protein M5689_010589 [Euphorbia peplus]|nr:hypothetical protein M5689_010589 [Euphorbia peplus]